jgi:hypothetical protein
MLARIRSNLSYANVMATIAVFVALGGGAYAASQINGASLKDRSVAGRKIKVNGLTGTEVRESSLATVPRAKGAQTLGGKGASAFVQNGQPAGGSLAGSYPSPGLRCPVGTTRQSGVCYENSARAAADWYTAADACAAAGRRLPTPSELWAIAYRAKEGGWTSTITTYENGPNAYTVATVVNVGPYATVTLSVNAKLAYLTSVYRCVIDAGNS